MFVFRKQKKKKEKERKEIYYNKLSTKNKRIKKKKFILDCNKYKREVLVLLNSKRMQGL